MSQLFNLQLATDTLLTAAKQIGVPSEQLQKIRIRVSASIVQQPQQQLWLNYQIQLPSATLTAQLDWPIWQQAQVSFTDYLWERTCLECFISGKAISTDETKKSSYIEINASPNGQYALYKFNSYRTPSILPPAPLLQADGHIRAHILWANNVSNQQIEKDASLQPNFRPMNLATNLTATEFIPYYQYQRSFGLCLNQVPSRFFDPDSLNGISIELLHPCVILRFGETNLYFASAHASPPDFHQRRYWSQLDYQAALSK